MNNEPVSVDPVSGKNVSRPLWLRWLKIFEPAPPAEITLTDPAEIKSSYRYWQKRVLISSIIGYALFYFVRKNLSIAMPVIEKDLGISKSQLGIFLTLHGLLYGVSKFANGFLGDRSNARTFMVTGLVLSALMNVFFGLSAAVVTFGIIWMLNGWFQGMGFPPCARLMTHWFPPKELATKMSIWNTSHCIGGFLVALLCGFLAVRQIRFDGVTIHGWQLCFFVPALLAFLCAIYLWRRLPDTPPSVGLPELEETKQSPLATKSAEEGKGFNSFVWRNVFSNKYIWIIALANFFVYVVRYAVFDWGTSMLTQNKGMSLPKAAAMIGAFELSGIVGMPVSGWLTDKVFRGRGARACVFFMLCTGISLFLFWKLPDQSTLMSAILLGATGFFIYGPQCLVGITVANLATKKAAATAVGLTGLLGYASTVLSGWGFGTLVKNHGWDAGFFWLMVATALGTLLFLTAWNAKADGYSRN